MNERPLTDDFNDFPFPLPDVLAVMLLLVVLGMVSISFSLSSLVALCSFSTHVAIELLGAIAIVNDGGCLLSECCRLRIRSRNDTFGLVTLAIDPVIEAGIKPAITLDAFKELNIAFDATVSLIVVTAGPDCAD